MNDTLHTYTFDAENKILKVDNTTAYVYDGEGQRVKKLVGENTRFIYGIRGGLVAEFNGSTGSLKKEYVYGAGMKLPSNRVLAQSTQLPIPSVHLVLLRIPVAQ